MGYRNDISIDKHDMQNECARQPALYGEYLQKHADALKERRTTELELEEYLAGADERIRASLAGEKTSETEIKRLVTLDSVVMEQQRKVIDVSHEVNVLAAAVTAFADKTRMLEAVMKMQLAHWQSEPKSSRGGREDLEDEVRRGQEASLNANKPAGKKRGGLSKV